MEQSEPSDHPSPEAPDWLKSILWALHHIRTNLDALMKAPVLVALVAVAVVGFIGGRADRTEQHDIDQQRISFLQDQITAYRDRLRGATPDEAAKRFSTLENALSIASRKLARFMPDKQRRLTDDDKSFIKAHAVDFKKAIPFSIEIFGMSLGDSMWYATDFADAFKAIGIVFGGPTPAPCNDNQDGILVGMKNPSKPSPNALSFIDLLTEMNMRPTPTRWYAAPDDSSFDLFVCAESINPPAASPPSPTPPASPPGR